MSIQYEAVFCVVNEGFSETVMYAARKAGAYGATIVKGHGSSGREAQEMFRIEIQPQKEIVIMVVPADIKDAVLKEVYNAAGLDSKGQGLAFSLPVTGTAGLSDFEKDKEEKQQDQGL